MFVEQIELPDRIYISCSICDPRRLGVIKPLEATIIEDGPSVNNKQGAIMLTDTQLTGSSL